MTGLKRAICTLAGTKVVLIGILSALAANATFQTPSLTVSGASGAPGTNVTLDVSMTLGSGTAPASVQWDLTYSTADLSLVTGTYDGTGAAASGAGKAADCNVISAGDVRCIISGINVSSIGNGVLATLTFQIAAGTLDSSTPVSLTGGLASDGSANPLSVSDSGATVTINQPAPVLDAINCSPTTVLPPASSTCTVSTVGNVPSTTTISLSSGVAQATVPASVNIAAGHSSTTFNVSTTAVGANTTALITATLGVSVDNFSLTLTTSSSCTYALSANSSSIGSSAGSGSVNVITSSGCAWTVTNNSTFITITGGGSGTGNGTVSYSFTADAGDGRSGTLTIVTQTFTVTQAGLTSAGLAFYPLTPCRIADTRTGSGFSGYFGAPYLSAGVARSFPIPSSACNVPGTAQAYSVNFGALPHGALGYLTTWPTGSSLPLVGTLGSPSGSAVSNAALVPAGTGGAISLYANDATDVIIDINGYFAPPNMAQALAFYPITPCRVADTRANSGFDANFGPPSLSANTTRTFPMPSSGCGLPSTAEAYSLNFGALPHAPLEYLTTWQAGSSLPLVGTLGSPSGSPVSNAALVPAGTGAAISVNASADTDVIIDSNGYFAAPGSAGALYFYPLTPCRIADTRSVGGFSGFFGPPTMTAGTTRNFPIPSSSCSIPASAQAYSLNIGVVTPGALTYLTVWPAGQSMPVVGTLSASGAGVVSDAAIVPAGTNGGIDVYVSNTTDVIIDIDGYFAP